MLPFCHRRTITFVSDGQEDRFIIQDCLVRILHRTDGPRAGTELPNPQHLHKMMQNRRENNEFCRMLTKNSRRLLSIPRLVAEAFLAFISAAYACYFACKL
jgi:hypothetical protein